MPKLVWSNVETGADIIPSTDLPQTDIDVLINQIELGEEYGLTPRNRPPTNLVVLSIQTSEDVTTLSARIV